MAADDETVERHAIAANFGTIGELLKQGGAALRTAELDVLHDENASVYWERDEGHDLVISLNHGQPALEALCRVLEAWVAHFVGSSAAHPGGKNHRLTTTGSGTSGLDAQASAVLNDLYQGHRRERTANGRHAVPVQLVVRRARGAAARGRRASRCTWRWRWTSTSASSSSPRTCCSICRWPACRSGARPCKTGRAALKSLQFLSDIPKSEAEGCMVPHLITALTGPINELEQRVLESMPAIERWFRLEWMEHTPPFYSSVDIRNAGFKLAPVDTNLYPGGWNNLTQEMLPLARAVGDGRDREDLPRGQEPAGDSREPHPQHVLPEQPGPAQAHLPHGRAERAHRLDRPRDQGADQHRPARRRLRCCWSRSCAASAGWG